MKHRQILVALLAGALTLTAAPTAIAGGKVKPVHAMPKELADAFDVFFSPAVRSVPSVVVHAGTTDSRKQFGLYAELTRRIAVGRHVLYVVPGRDGLCLVQSGGISACGKVSYVIAHSISMTLMPPVQGRSTRRRAAPGSGPARSSGTEAVRTGSRSRSSSPRLRTSH